MLLGPKRQSINDANFETLFFGHMNSALFERVSKKRKLSVIMK